MDKPKYELTNETRNVERGTVKVYRVRALQDFGEGAFKVKKGELGGFVQSEENLSHTGNAWVSDLGCVYNKALVSGNAQVFGAALVGGHAQVFDNAQVFDDAELGDRVVVGGDARVGGDAHLFGHLRLDGDGCMTGNTPVYGMTDFQSRFGTNVRPGRGVIKR
jgi:hypothetical protein